MRVAFQGEIGAFSEEAVRSLFPTATVVPCPSFEAVFEAVENGTVDRGVIPIENSLFGSVHVNYDLLRSHTLHITDELHLRIRHNLMALPDVSPEAITDIYSHPQALGQCRAYIRTHFPHATTHPVYDTAGAAKMIAANQQRGAAAIASARAAAEYGLNIQAASIESNHQNYTRFLVLATPAQRMDAASSGTPTKTSVVYAIRENVPGALFKSLAVFALRDIDLYKIESRPLIGSPGQYLFYLDLGGTHIDTAVQRALEHLREISAFVKVLGSYPLGRTV